MDTIVGWALVIFGGIMLYIAFSLIPSPLFIFIFCLALIAGWVYGGRQASMLEEQQRREDEYYRNLEKRLQELEEKANEKK